MARLVLHGLIAVAGWVFAWVTCDGGARVAVLVVVVTAASALWGARIALRSDPRRFGVALVLALVALTSVGTLFFPIWGEHYGMSVEHPSALHRHYILDLGHLH